MRTVCVRASRYEFAGWCSCGKRARLGSFGSLKQESSEPFAPRSYSSAVVVLSLPTSPHCI
eukprot:2703405-Pleurochrysis_carterae.AAC.1